MPQSLRTNNLFEQIIREEYENSKPSNPVTNIILEQADTTLATLAKSTDNDSSKAVPKLGIGSRDATAPSSTYPAAKPITSKLMTSTSVNDPNYKMKNPWNNKKAMDAIKAMGGKPYAFIGTMDKFELVLIQGSSATDRLDLKEDGSLYSGQYSGTLNWELLPGGKLQISINKIAGQINLGTIYPSGGKAYFEPDAKLTAAIEKQASPVGQPAAYDEKKAAARLDLIQYIADWCGIVPVFGDAIDLINGLVYVGRGKYWDAMFSFIGVIPLIGSVANLVAKTGKLAGKIVAKYIKALSKIPGIKSLDDINRFLMRGNSDEIAKIWGAWISNQLFKPHQAKLYMDFLLNLKKNIQKPTLRAAILKLSFFIPRLAKKEVEHGLDEVVQFCTSQSDGVLKALKQGDEAVDVTEKMADIALGLEKGLIKPEVAMSKLAVKGLIKPGWKGVVMAKGSIGYKKVLTAFFLKRMSNVDKLNPSVLQGVQTMMMKRFVKQWGKQTDDLAQLLATTPGANKISAVMCRFLTQNGQFMQEYIKYMAKRPTYVRQVSKQLVASKQIKIGPASFDQIVAYLNKNQTEAIKYLNENLFFVQGKLKSVPELTQVLNYIGSFKTGTEPSKLLSKMAQLVVQYAAKNMNPIYVNFAADAGNQLLAYFQRAKTGLGKQLKDELMQNLFSARKKLDILASEIEDITEYIYTFINPESYYKKGTIQSLPTATAKNSKTGEYLDDSMLMAVLRNYAKYVSKFWGSMEDDEQNGILFEVLLQPKLEELRVAGINDYLNTPAGEYLKKQLDTELQPGKVIMKQFTGLDVGMDKSLSKTKGFNPGEIDTKDNEIYPIGY